jgi:hypothetical protein
LHIEIAGRQGAGFAAFITMKMVQFKLRLAYQAAKKKNLYLFKRRHLSGSKISKHYTAEI